MIHLELVQLTKRYGDVVSVDRQGSPGQGPRAERQYVDALAALVQTLLVTTEHLVVGEHVVRQEHGLGALCFEDPNETEKLEQRQMQLIHAEKLAEVIRERFRLKGQVKAASAHGRLTATILMLMPIATMFALLVVSPGYLQGMAKDSDGRYLIGFAIIGQFLGNYFIRRIIKIKV